MKLYPQRRTVRLQDYDYGSEGSYFITVCSYRRQHFFGEIRNGSMCLSTLGALVWAEWEKTFVMRAHYLPHAFVVMPNHLHALYSITRPQDDAWNAARIEAFARPAKDTNASMIRGIKSAITSAARKEGLLASDAGLWQGRMWDHVVRSQQEFDKIEQYIYHNIRNWREDCFFA